MSLEQNTAIARMHYKDVLEQGHVELIDSYWTPDGSIPDMLTPQQLKDKFLWWHKVAPGFKITILDEVAECNKVVIYWQADVTYSVPPEPTAEQPLLPLGKPANWRGMSLFHIVDGKIVAHQAQIGWREMLVESGAYTLEKTPQY
jgi:hypothetical protein